MAPRHPLPPVSVDAWAGVDQFNDAASLPPSAWPDALNVVIGANGNAIALRSPANLNTALTTGNSVLSGACYDRIAGFLNVFDIQTVGTTLVSTYITTNGANTLLRSGQANARWCSQNVNDRLYRVNGSEFVQIVSALSVYANGTTKPAAAPTAAMTAGTSTLTLAVGVTASYAYYNGTTAHIGECSDVSGSSGAGTNQILRVGVVASAQSGVSHIVLFLTEDSGSVRYLVVDTNGTPVLYANSTGNIDITAPYYLNYNVEETVFNAPPVLGATHISTWKSRLMLAGFVSTVMSGMAAYSGFDQISIGQPWETWPPLNLLPLPAKSERLLGGIDTPVGWLGLSVQNAFLLTGAPTDKVDSGVNTIQVSEQFRQLSWQLGTRSILTLVNSPFGTIYLDQNKHLQFWTYQGQPQEIVMGLRPELESILDTTAARAMAEGAWFPSGKSSGFYVLTGQIESYASIVLESSPSLFPLLDEREPSTAVIDSSGNGLNGTYQNTPTLGAQGPLNGPWSKAVTLNGINEYLSFPDSLLLNPGNTFTLGIWVYVTAYSVANELFEKGGGSYYLTYGNTGRLTLGQGHVGAIVSSITGALPLNTWCYVVAVKDGSSSSKLYVNGVDVTDYATYSDKTILTSADTLVIGAGEYPPAGGFITASIALPAIYPTALSAATIAAQYAARLLSVEGLVNNRMWIVTFAKQPDGSLMISGAPSDIAAQCVFISRVNNTVMCVIGVTDRLRQLLDFETQGAGWPTGTKIYFDCIANNASLWSTLHNILYDGTNAQFIFVQARDLVDQSIRTLQPMQAGGSYSALVNAYGRRQKLRFNYATDDAAKQEIMNLRLISSAKKRTL